MEFQSFPAFVPLLITALISVVVGILAWRRRPAPGATAFSLMAFSMAVWQLFSALEGVAMGLELKTLLSQAVYLGHGAPTFWLIFALQYSTQGQWGSPRSLALLAIEPVLMAILVLTTRSHHLVYSAVRLQQVGPYQVMVAEHGLAFWIHVIYTYTIMLVGSVALVRSLRSVRLFRVQSAALVGGILAPWLGNLIYLAGLAPYNMDLTGPGFVVASVLFLWALFRQRLLDLVPLARPVAVKMMQDGVAVLDRLGRVAELNPVAQRITGYDGESAVGKPAAEVFAGQPQLVSYLGTREPVQVELSVGSGNVASKSGQSSAGGAGASNAGAGGAAARKSSAAGTSIDDGARFYDVRVTPLHQGGSPGGSPAGWVVIWHDVTERKRREEELRRAWQAAEAASLAKSTFLSNMSHDLRTPLNAIIGYSEMLQEEAQERGWHQYLPDLQKIHAAGQHLLAFLSDILDIARIEAGRMSRSVEAFRLQPLVEEVAAAVRPVAEQYGNRLQLSGVEGIGEVRLDRAKLRQVLYGLLHNACKFTDKGTVTLSAARERGRGGEWLILQVSDTGPGIAPEELGRIFEPYTRVSTLRRPRAGAGLGLAIAQRFCHLMEGHITVQSQPGKGATFTVRLPARLEEPAVAAVPVTGAPVAGAPAIDGVRVAGGVQAADGVRSAHGVRAVAGAAAGSAAGSAASGAVAPASGVRAQFVGDGEVRLLVIDDDPTVHDLIRRILTREGFRVAAAPNGPEGIRLARQLRPDLITLDVMMPGMDGWATLAAIKADEELTGIPVVMMTSLDDRNMGFKLGAADFIIKPVTRERLLRALARYQRLQASA